MGPSTLVRDAFLVGHSTVSVLLIFKPGAYVYSAVGASEGALAVLDALSELPFEPILICRGEDSRSMWLVIEPLSVVRALGVARLKHAPALTLVTVVHAGVKGAVCIGVCTLTVLHVGLEAPLIVAAVRVLDVSNPIRHVFLPVSFINYAVRELLNSEAMAFVVEPTASVRAPVRVELQTFTVPHPIQMTALIV